MQTNPWGCDIWFDLSRGQGPDTVVTPSGDWKLVTGQACLRQSLIRRYLTKPGSWKTKPNYGAGLIDLVRKKMTTSNRDEAINRIRAQSLRDTRVKAVDSVTISRLTSPSGEPKSGWRLHVVVVPKIDPKPLDVEFQVSP